MHTTFGINPSAPAAAGTGVGGVGAAAGTGVGGVGAAAGTGVGGGADDATEVSGGGGAAADDAVGLGEYSAVRKSVRKLLNQYLIQDRIK